MAAPANATEIALKLAGMANDLYATVKALESADLEAVQKRGTFDLAFSRAFIAEQGSVETRKHLAVIATERQRNEAEVADAVVRHLRRKLDAIKTNIDVGRSYGAALRAEISLGGSGMEP